jgi:receptor expression-enhancing protein 1/2/3/4
VFGLPPTEPPPPPAPSTFSYTQNLLARFNLPAARPAVVSGLGGATSTATEFYSLLASAVNAASSSHPAATPSQARDLSNSGTLIPPNVHGDERLSFISAQRDRLSFLLSALDKEASNVQTRSPRLSTSAADGEALERTKSAMSSRKSETDFEKIEAESGAEDELIGGKKIPRASQGSSGSWLPWGWGGKPESSGETHSDTTGTMAPEDRGKSSGVEI